jgi:hypothetical protein
MRFMMIIALLTASCGPAPQYPVCDYCKKQREDAKIYACRKCGKSHMSCRIEGPMHAMDARKDKEGVALGWSIKNCPEGP